MFESVFKDINISEFTLFGLGPVTGKFFSHYGATVVRVESSLRPDPTRMWPPFANNEPGINRGGFWAHMNTSKRSVCLNLKHPKSADVTKRLIEWSDIVIENFTPGVLESWGLGYEELIKIRPDTDKQSGTYGTTCNTERHRKLITGTGRIHQPYGLA
jgi:benzylsuccinate CoA-transferase BbsF subunit